MSKFVCFYKANKFTGELRASREGPVAWLKRGELAKQNLAPDMMEMVRVMESDSLSEFFYTKENGKWKYTLF